MISRKKQLAQMDLVLEEVTRNTKNKIRELSYSYERLSQILKKMPTCQWNLQEEEILTILGRTSLETCEGCSEYDRCYRTEKEMLFDEVSRFLRRLEKQGTLASASVSQELEGRCRRCSEFLSALIQSYEIMGVNKVWQNKLLAQRRAMASQMEEMSRILFGCSNMLGYDRARESAKVRKLRQMLKREKVILGPVRFYENAGKKQEIFLMASSRGDHYPAGRVCELLGRLIRKNMIPAQDCRMSIHQENTMLHFEEDCNYYVLCGHAGTARADSDVSGDIFSVMKPARGRQICILADGMGSGTAAKAESQYVVELMEQLLEAGFQEEETVRLANSMLTFGLERTMYSSFDFLSIHLYTGLVKMIKSGSAATFIVRKEKVEIVNSKTPPTGFLWEVEFDVLYKKLYDGDKVVLVSDGILDHLETEEPEMFFAEDLPQLCRETPQRAAEDILAWTLRQKEKPPGDDMSVLVIAVWKKNHPF